MDFDTVVKTRRSVRSYADQPVPDDVLQRVLETAQSAPSAYNRQPWRFIVIKEPATRTTIAQLAAEQEFVGEAAVVIACCGHRYAEEHSWLGDGLYVVDVAIAIDHLTLAARNEGLGTCWIGAFDHEALKMLLKVPADHDILMFTPLGYPAAEGVFRPTDDRLPLAEIVFRERFGDR